MTGHSYIANYASQEQISSDNVTYWCSCLAHNINESQCCFLCQLWLIVKVSYIWVTIGYFDDIIWLITCNCCQIQSIRSQLLNFIWIVTGHSYIANYISKRQMLCDNVTYWFICLTPINNESQCCFTEEELYIWQSDSLT